ncbi:MAG: hypothetical protein EPN23_06715 [Verrucomicrobia bacterium]|nr:MAG: hypothetical protein EPN23_06715 [Verrucomicrobiota bacterium]
MRSRNNLFSVVVAVWALSLSTGWAQTDVRAVVRLWQQHLRTPADHAAIIQAAQQVASQFPDSAMLGVAQNLGGWHALVAGQTNDAIRLLAPLLTERTEPIGMEAHTMAQRWLTRLDRERVCSALKNYYRDHVEFPASLDALNALPVTNRPPLMDRFGRAWKYELTALKRLTTMRGQNYRLQSYALGDDSELAAALRRPYGGGLVFWKPLRFLPAASAGAPSNVAFEKGGTKIILAEGSRQMGVTLVYSREDLIIITDGDYWQLFAR